MTDDVGIRSRPAPTVKPFPNSGQFSDKPVVSPSGTAQSELRSQVTEGPFAYEERRREALAFAKEVRSAHPGTTVDLGVTGHWGNAVIIQLIKVPMRQHRQGIGSAVLTNICRRADERGWSLVPATVDRIREQPGGVGTPLRALRVHPSSVCRVG